MTKIEELEQKLNEMERELKNTVNAIEENIGNEISDLRGALAELKESKKEGKWKPKDGDTYYYRTEYSGISSASFTNDLDELRYRNTLLFPTYEECLRYCRFMDTVKEKSYEFSKEEWEDEDVKKYVINYSFYDKEFSIDNYCSLKKMGTTYFKDEGSAQYIIDNFKDELMKFWI